MNNLNYVTMSLDLHLFFARIMKEHAIFLEAGFTPANSDFAKTADGFKIEFENLLMRVVSLSCGVVSPNVLISGETVTEFTMNAERQTQHLTGIQINTNITQQEQQLINCPTPYQSPNMTNEVSKINRSMLMLLDQFIAFKESVLKNVRTCAMFTANYPTLIAHVLKEAQLYRQYIISYENGNFNVQTRKQIEEFWNHIMLEHALFIRGMLDPIESKLIHTADNFANEYRGLLDCITKQTTMVMANNQCNPYNETLKFKEFKTAGVKGILNCEIQSVIAPLLADHVLREANHYLRLLSQQ